MPSLGNVPRPAYVYDTETDTWVPIGVGAHTHDTLYINQNTIDAKGDLIVGTGDNSYSRLAAPTNNGETLVVDSSTTTGLRWSADWNTGKNKIINGDFFWNQRAFTSSTSTNIYTFDRWLIANSGSSITSSAQTFTAGAAPVAGYEGKNFFRIVTASQSAAGDYASVRQRIEDVRTLAGQTATISFWAKAASGTPLVGISVQQTFGTGGSSQTNTNGNVTISTSWTRYSVTLSIPSVSGKTISETDSSLDIWFITSMGSTYTAYSPIGIQNNTIDIWGVQVEAGSVATPFTTATGTIQGELAACQRYYWRIPGTNNIFYAGFNNSTTQAYSAIPLPVTMRVRPTTTVTSAANTLAVRISGGTNVGCNGTTAIIGNTTQNIWFSTTVASGLTAGQGSALVNLGSSEAIEMSAEL